MTKYVFTFIFISLVSFSAFSEGREQGIHLAKSMRMESLSSIGLYADASGIKLTLFTDSLTNEAKSFVLSFKEKGYCTPDGNHCYDGLQRREVFNIYSVKSNSCGSVEYSGNYRLEKERIQGEIVLRENINAMREIPSRNDVNFCKNLNKEHKWKATVTNTVYIGGKVTPLQTLKSYMEIVNVDE